ncbi:CHASE domain-containing protein [Jiella avicenniae]|uniref:CHASE domain-containing protein n=1 Tax=Jiella avicenniae TaxID=2907202 RepID=UPI001F1BBA26
MVVFSLAAAIGLSLAGQLWMSREDADRRRFARITNDAVGRVSSRLELHLSLLYAARSFVAVAGPEVPVEAFRRYVGGLDLAERFDGIQGIGLALTIRPTEAAALGEDLTARYGRPVKVWPPATDEAVRTPIVLLEPQDERNRVALGFDMYSDATRRQAIDAAAESGGAVASAPVRLVQEIDENRQFGFLIYLPLAPAGAAGAGPVGETPGFVYAPFRIGDMLSAALFDQPLLPIHVEVFDGTAAPDNLIFASADTPPPGGPDLSVERRIDVAGRSWLLKITPSERFERLGSNYPAALLAAFVLFLASTLALLTLVQARRLEAVAALNRESERSLAQKDMHLREMNHRIKNSIARMLSIARQTARRATSLDDFVESYSARLQAMAAAQEMLARSQWSEAELRDLLATELAQVFGDDHGDYRLDGPAIKVDETVAQALGLTFHEIATNAMKYGALSDPAGSLTVAWRQDGSDLLIDWLETGGDKPDLPAAKSGFGTRLIDMTIRGELRGSIERTVEGDLFSIRIRFPFAPSKTSQQRAVPGSRL